jgi:TatD DNase family protein
MIDSHCHLNCLTGNLDEIMLDAKKAGVKFILCPGIDPLHFDEIINITNKYPNVKAGLGLHPNDVNEHEFTTQQLYDAASHPNVIAIGETGLDYYRDNSDPLAQQRQFISHIEVSKALAKPLIIHARDSHADILKILQQHKVEKAILHCFTASYEIATAAIDLGCMISFSGIITFKNAKDLQNVVSNLDLKHLLIETDAPYLAPEPYRGKMNQPAYVGLVAQKIAELQKLETSVVIEQTTNNFLKLFNLSLD